MQVQYVSFYGPSPILHGLIGYTGLGQNSLVLNDNDLGLGNVKGHYILSSSLLQLGRMRVIYPLFWTKNSFQIFKNFNRILKKLYIIYHVIVCKHISKACCNKINNYITTRSLGSVNMAKAFIFTTNGFRTASVSKISISHPSGILSILVKDLKRLVELNHKI